MRTYLLVEHPITLVNVRDVALVLVEPLPRELVPFILSANREQALTNQHAAPNDKGKGEGRGMKADMTYSWLSFPITRSMASSLGLLSAYKSVLASLYSDSAARCCSYDATCSFARRDTVQHTNIER